MEEHGSRDIDPGLNAPAWWPEGVAFPSAQEWAAERARALGAGWLVDTAEVDAQRQEAAGIAAKEFGGRQRESLARHLGEPDSTLSASHAERLNRISSSKLGCEAGCQALRALDASAPLPPAALRRAGAALDGSFPLERLAGNAGLAAGFEFQAFESALSGEPSEVCAGLRARSQALAAIAGPAEWEEALGCAMDHANYGFSAASLSPERARLIQALCGLGPAGSVGFGAKGMSTADGYACLMLDAFIDGRPHLFDLVARRGALAFPQAPVVFLDQFFHEGQSGGLSPFSKFQGEGMWLSQGQPNARAGMGLRALELGLAGYEGDPERLRAALVEDFNGASGGAFRLFDELLTLREALLLRSTVKLAPDLELAKTLRI